jgi:hypothetical protein
MPRIRTMILTAAFAAAACSSSTTTTGGSSGTSGPAAGPGDGGSSGSSSPCGPDGVYGTFLITGTLNGTESICGLSLGSFDGGTLTVAQGSSSGATVSVSGSGAGHIDVSDCAATVTTCHVTATKCKGATDTQASVTLDVSVTTDAASGSSQLGFNGCQAPGLPFDGKRR